MNYHYLLNILSKMTILKLDVFDSGCVCVCDSVIISYNFNNLMNYFSIIAFTCGARRVRSCATAYLLMGAQHTLRAGIVRVDGELFHQTDLVPGYIRLSAP